MQKYIKNLNSKVSDVKEFEEKVDTKAQQKLNEIQKFFEIVLKLVKTKRDDLCSGIKNTLKKETEKYTKIKSNLETHLESAKSQKRKLLEYLNMNSEDHTDLLYNVFQREKSIKDCLKSVDDIKFVNNIKDFNIHTEIKTLCQSISSTAVNFVKQSEQKKETQFCNKENIDIRPKELKTSKNSEILSNLNSATNLNSVCNSEFPVLTTNIEKKNYGYEAMGITKLKKDVVCGISSKAPLTKENNDNITKIKKDVVSSNFNSKVPLLKENNDNITKLKKDVISGNFNSKVPLIKENNDEPVAKPIKKHSTSYINTNFVKNNKILTKATNNSLSNINAEKNKQLNSKRDDNRKSRIKNTTRDASPFGLPNNSYLNTKDIKKREVNNKSTLNDRRGEKKAMQNNFNASITPNKILD